MTKVVITSLNTKSRRAGQERNSVTVKRVRDIEGHRRTVRTLDVGSATFGSDLQYVFGRNVAKARRENKQAIGTSDVAITKR